MKATFSPILALVFLFTGCNTRPHEEATTNAPATPEALQDDYKTISSYTKREANLLQQLYDELVAKDTTLNGLENNIRELPDHAAKAIKEYDQFNRKTHTYYQSANSYIEGISDSVLRDKLKRVIKESLAQYDVKTGHHKALLERIDSQKTTLRDLHTVLMITRTLPIIEKYETDHLPPAKTLEELHKEYEQIIRQTTTNSKL